MKASEIVNYVMEQRALRKQVKAPVAGSGQAQPVVSAGKREPILNRPTKKKRNPYMGPVMVQFSWPKRTMLLGQDSEK